MIIWDVFRFFIVDRIVDILYFPVWWYTEATAALTRSFLHRLHTLTQRLHVRTLMRYLFQPMYGQTDLWGRIISLLMRFVYLILLSIITLLYSCFFAVLLLLWLALFPAAILSVVYHFGLWPLGS